MKKLVYINNNSFIDILLDKNHIYIDSQINNSSYKSHIDILKINFLKYFNIIYKKNYFFVRSWQDIFILTWFIKSKIKNNLRGYCLILNLIGLGFTMTIWKKKELRFNIGYNHLIYYKIPKGIIIISKSRRNLYLFSNSYFFLKKIGTEIKSFRLLSIYKLKGIKDKNELYIKKNWKKGLY
jgi:large subunit ribosomal protein L6